MNSNMHLWRLVGAVAFALLTFAIGDKVSLLAEPQQGERMAVRATEGTSPQHQETEQVGPR